MRLRWPIGATAAKLLPALRPAYSYRDENFCSKFPARGEERQEKVLSFDVSCQLKSASITATTIWRHENDSERHCELHTPPQKIRHNTSHRQFLVYIKIEEAAKIGRQSRSCLRDNTKNLRCYLYADQFYCQVVICFQRIDNFHGRYY